MAIWLKLSRQSGSILDGKLAQFNLTQHIRLARKKADELPAERIRTIKSREADGDPAYGTPRVTAELNEGVKSWQRVNRKRVTRVMHENLLAGVRLRRRVRTAVPERSDHEVSDLVKRDFIADVLNQKYVGDITYLPLSDGSNLYLATVIGFASRKLAGWAVSNHMRVELIEDALKDAALTRGTLDVRRSPCHTP